MAFPMKGLSFPRLSDFICDMKWYEDDEGESVMLVSPREVIPAGLSFPSAKRGTEPDLRGPFCPHTL